MKPKEKIIMIQEMFQDLNLIKEYNKSEQLRRIIESTVDEVRYLIPIFGDEIDHIDLRIKKLIDDIKIAVYQSKDNIKCEVLINRLNKLIEERNTYI